LRMCLARDLALQEICWPTTLYFCH
jgi:hypothetical protein